MTQPEYAYGGARALVDLHEEYVREFLATWRMADARDLQLPASDDPNLADRDALLAHVLGCAARYLTWMCERLETDVPELEERPPAEGLPDRADEYLETVLQAWRGPQLRTMTEKQAYESGHPSRWKTEYCLDAMLEHAVMHPLRHTRQLRRLMAQ